MPVRAVVLPATPLLVPGAAGSADPAAGVRAVVRAAVHELLDDALDDAVPAGRTGGRLAVLAHRTGAAGSPAAGRPMRPSLAGAGIPARWAPVVGADDGPPETAQVPASVALACLGEALAARGSAERLRDVVVHEVPAGLAGSPDDVARVADAVRAAAGVVVAGGGPPGGLDAAPDALAPGVAAVLSSLRAPAGTWVPEVRVVRTEHEHLPGEYHVTLLREA
ncbi:hypothetical protein L600_002100000510 [Isoptericola variabilis J7]|uniref:hypothetical protein n=1 Tax=Isoptericola variabilis TaxID=139208 RepID=UPI00119DDC41|nr:hypothetical protein [Isoptericola variabilis]TWH31787.1 hypothetical protein L600_002100000510 [Isoptericola variabilis J7]